MLLCSKDALNWSKVTEYIYNLTKDFHFQSSLFGIDHPKMKIESSYTMLNPEKQCFVFIINNNKNTNNTTNNKCFLSIKSAYYNDFWRIM